MVASQVATHRRFVGTACLYRHLALRQPPFLRRNLDQALDRHEKLLATSRDAVDGLGGDMSADERRVAGWDYPTVEMMEGFLKGQKPVLGLEALQIRRVGVETHGDKSTRLQKVRFEPDWLPDPSIDFSAPCLVTLMFIDPGKDLNRQERVHVDTRSGTIESSTANGKDRVFDVTLEESFSIEVEKIFVTVWKGPHSKRTIPVHYQLNVEIKCLHQSDARHFLRLMENKSASKYRDSLTESDATLRATWYDLPECPPPGKLLDVTRTDGPEHSIKMNFGVELSMGWNSKKDSPITIWAKKRRAALVPDQVQLPTPSASDESESATKQHVVTYVFMNKRYHRMKDLRCPLCATASTARAQHEFPAFDRLHTHILLWHDHFQPRIELTKCDHTDGVTILEHTIHFSLASSLTEVTAPPRYEGDEDHWIAPERPFDVKAYLKGVDTWTGHEGRAEKPQPNVSKKQPSSGPGTSKARPALLEIKDIPDLPKPRWPLPKIPRIRFFRTKSKRPFEADEVISESDDEVDESWLRAHKRDDLESLSISTGGKEFYQDWNLAATADDFPATVFARECLVRFARKHRGKMWDDEYYAEFMKVVTQLHRLKIVDAEIYDYCANRRRLASDVMDKTVSGRRHGAAEGHLGGSQSAASENLNAQARKTCSCGLPVTSVRGAVVCHNIYCARVQYHMACAGLTRRVDDWKCPECRANEMEE